MRFLAAAICLCFASPVLADTLIDNVVGLTLDDDGDIRTFNALLIDDKGRIAEVLDRNDKRPKKVEYRLDGKGRILIPGLVDSHAHMMDLGLAQLKAKAGFEGDPRGDPRPEDRDLAFAEAQELLLANGITTVADMGTTIEDWQAYRRSGDRGALQIRLVAYAKGTANMALIGGPGPTPWLYDGRLKQTGVVITLDGPLHMHKAWLKAPYADKPGELGEPALNEVRLRNLMSRAAIDNFQIAVEAHGDAATASVLDAIDELDDTYGGDRRWRIEGASLVDAADLARLGQSGVMISMQSPDMDVASSANVLGPERFASLHRWRSLRDAGVMPVFGSGTCSGKPQPFALMATAIARQISPGAPFTPWQAQERLAREDAFAAFTAAGAKALFAEGRIGRIARGLNADFLFIDRDPLLVSPNQLAQTRVLETWIGGVKVFDAHKGIGKSAIDSFKGR